MIDDTADITASGVLAVMLALAFAGHALASAHAGRALSARRVEREQGLPVVGRAPMHAVYRPLLPLGRGLAGAGVRASHVTLFSLAAAALAAVAIALGHLGVGAALGCVAALADAVDGIVARASGSASPAGKVLDTTVDRYVDALLLGGLAVLVRHSVALLVVVLGAIVGGFMVSYASSVERELGVTDSGGLIPMRRAHRLAYLLAAMAAGPLVGHVAGTNRPLAGLVPALVAATVIAVGGNASAVRRLLIAGSRAAAKARPRVDSAPDAAADEEPPLSEAAGR